MKIPRWIALRRMSAVFVLLPGSIGLALTAAGQQELSAPKQPVAAQNAQERQPNTTQEKTLPIADQNNVLKKEVDSSNKQAEPSLTVGDDLGQQPSPSRPQETEPQKPTGAATAEKEKTSGVAGSQPSGAAIAPPKQHRSRAFFIKLGAAVGASVAVGTTLALSRSTPSKPPGAR